jgi:hypothetical protein
LQRLHVFFFFLPVVLLLLLAYIVGLLGDLSLLLQAENARLQETTGRIRVTPSVLPAITPNPKRAKGM